MTMREQKKANVFDGPAAELWDDADWAIRTSVQLSLSPDQAAEVSRRAGLVRDRLADPRLRLAVVGEFNSGKSTFVNTLLRDRLLPTAPVVTTGTATEIQHGDTLSVSFRPRGDRHWFAYPDERKGGGGSFVTALRRIDRAAAMPATARDAIATLIADERVCVGVDTVTITHPAALLGGDVVLIDTPGINATDDLHAEVVDRVIAESADLAVVLVPAMSQVSHTLSDFVAGPLGRHVDRCVFVVTKLDDVEPDQRGLVLRAIDKRLRMAGVADPMVFSGGGTTVLDALVAGTAPDDSVRDFVTLEAELARLVRREHIRAVHTTATYLVEDMLTAATESAMRRGAELAEAARRLDALKVRDLDGLVAELAADAGSAFDDLLAELVRSVDSNESDGIDDLTGELDRRLNACTTMAEIKTLVETTAVQIVRTALDEWRTAVLSDMSSAFREVAERQLRFADSVFADEYARLAELAGQTAASGLPATSVRGADVSVDVDFGAAATNVGALISTENWATGGGAAVGAAIGTMLLPGLGSVVGALVGGWLGARVGSQVAKAREQVRGPLRDGCRDAVQRCCADVRDAVRTLRTRYRRQYDAGLTTLRAAYEPAVAELLAREQASRVELDWARELAATAEREARQRLSRLSERRAGLRGAAS